jgi:multidrug resistance efflux pump
MATELRARFGAIVLTGGLVGGGIGPAPSLFAQGAGVAPPINIVSEVEGPNRILSIVPDGTDVKRGQLLCELDAATLRDRLTNQQIALQAAHAAFGSSRRAREAAEIATREYEEGTFKQDLVTIDGEIKLAEADAARAKDRAEWATRMKEKGFVSDAQKASEGTNLQKARFKLEQARSKKNVLLSYTKSKTIKELNSEIEKARADELARKQTLDLEQAKEETLRDQISKCRMLSPVDGKVVRPKSNAAPVRSEPPTLKAGSPVHRGQIVMQIIPSVGAERGPESQSHAPAGSTAVTVSCPFDGRITVIFVLPEGTLVRKGQLLCELDSASLRDQIMGVQYEVERLGSEYQASKGLREVAEITVKEYLEGLYPEQKATAQGEIKVAEEELSLTEEELRQAKASDHKTAASTGEAGLAVTRARIHLEQSRTRLHVLSEYSHPRHLMGLKLGVENVLAQELAAKRRLQAARVKLEGLERQLANCRILAPIDGVLIHAPEPARSGLDGPRQSAVEDGMTVGERQRLFRIVPLADPRAMEKK